MKKIRTPQLLRDCGIPPDRNSVDMIICKWAAARAQSLAKKELRHTLKELRKQKREVLAEQGDLEKLTLLTKREPRFRRRREELKAKEEGLNRRIADLESLAGLKPDKKGGPKNC